MHCRTDRDTPEEEAIHEQYPTVREPVQEISLDVQTGVTIAAAAGSLTRGWARGPAALPLVGAFRSPHPGLTDGSQSTTRGF